MLMVNFLEVCFDLENEVQVDLQDFSDITLGGEVGVGLGNNLVPARHAFSPVANDG